MKSFVTPETLQRPERKILVPRVRLRLRAGISGFDTEPDMSLTQDVELSARLVEELRLNPAKLLALQVRDRGLEPMFFEDDWAVVDTGDTAPRSREVYALNWNGEACIAQLIHRGGQWYVSYFHTDFPPVNARSGQLNIVGRVVYQPGRVVTARL